MNGTRRIDLALMDEEQLDQWEAIQKAALSRAHDVGEAVSVDAHSEELASIEYERQMRVVDAA